MKKIALMALSILLATATLAQNDEPKTIVLTEAECMLVEQNSDFAFKLFRKACGEESCIMSPLSITYALGMMNNGAIGLTQQEINNVLGFGSPTDGSLLAEELGADGINRFCRKMLTEAPTLDEETIAEIANTIYVNSGMGYELQQGFIDKLNEFYDAQPETRNFHDGETWNVINQWANDHTHGMIPKIFASKDAFNEYAASYLLNAIYFKGVWANMFDKANTREEVFNGGETVPMMRQEEEYEYAENNLYQAVRLPYGNGAYQMTVFLPREDKTIDDVLATIDGHNWQFQKDGRFMVDLKLPRFKTETGLKLVPVMADLGMPSAFSEVAEFPYFCNRPVFIGDMFQKAVIDLDEEGTKAAAVTIIEVATSMPCKATFHANRPFFYIISERSTGVIFFIGQYTGSTTANILQTENSKNAKDNPTIYDLQGRIVLNGQLKKGLYIVGGKKVIVNRR